MPVLSDERQLIFYCAVPGSGWAKLSLLLSCCKKLNLNNSDRRPEWEERGKRADTEGIERAPIFHKGCFWDPKREYGAGFDDIGANYTKQEFIDECLRPFQEHDERNYLIRSHFFAETKNLNWLTENFPDNKIIFILREPGPAFNGWNNGMEFKGRYPNYDAWMKYTYLPNHPDNYQKLYDLIVKHDAMIRTWIDDKPVSIIQANRWFMNQLGYIWDEEGHEVWDSVFNYNNFFEVKWPSYDAPYVFYNCDDIFRIET